MSTINHLQDGQVFGRYQIVRLIGEGGMGLVYEATHPGLKRRFAIKILLPAVAQNEEARRRFLREGEAATSINHPNVVTVSDVGTQDGIPYLVMEFLDGRTLGDLLAEKKCLSVPEAARLLLPVISAVATGHDSGIIHRDLKPQNVFLANGRRGELIPKVLDFGVSKFTGEDNAVLTGTMAVLGTAAYMSPEQARGARHVGFASDQYSLGLILYEMLSGCRAHPGTNPLEILHNVASAIVRPIRELMPDLSPELVALHDRMLAATPTDRYPSLNDCGRTLLRFADPDTQIALADEFGATPGTKAPVGSSPAGAPTAAARAPSTLSTAGGIGSTLALPPSASAASAAGVPADTTLRHSAAEARSVASTSKAEKITRPNSRVVAAAGIGVAALVAILAATRLLLSKAPPSPPPPRPATLEAPSAAAVAPAQLPVREAQAHREPELPSTVPFDIRVIPPHALIALDNRPARPGHIEVVLPLAGALHQISVSAPGYLARSITFRGDEQPPAEIRLERSARSAADGKVSGGHRLEAPGASTRKTTLPRSSTLPSLPVGPTTKVTAGEALPAESPKAGDASSRRDAPLTPKRGSNNALIIK